MIFRCKNCGGNVVYSPEHKKMYCPYCDSLDSEERSEGNENIGQPDSHGKSNFICPSCGGEFILDKFTSATRCPYCDNYIIVGERTSGKYTPKTIIPFQIGKEAVKKSIRDNFKKYKFAPTDFLSEARLETMEGHYVPFWFYDYDSNYKFRGEGTKLRSWRSGDTEYTETSYYDIVRDMNIGFDAIPADASVKMPDEVMDLMEPYGYEQLEAFKPEYMSGFMAEEYNMESDLIKSRADMKLRRDADSIIKSTYSGYSSVRTTQNNLTVKNENASFGLLPVWKYDYTYNDMSYPFYVNGQTGKIVGTVPLSKKKIWSYAATWWGVLTALMVVINLIITWSHT